MADVNKSGITPHLPIMDHVGVYGRSLRTRKSSQAGGGDVLNRPATGHTVRCLETMNTPKGGSEEGNGLTLAPNDGSANVITTVQTVHETSASPGRDVRGLESSAKRDEK